MTLDEARTVIARRNRGDRSVSLHEHSAASVYLSSYYTHEAPHLLRNNIRDVPALTRDDAPPRPERADMGRTMEMPDGVWPKPPPITRSSGIPLSALARMGGAVSDDALERAATARLPLSEPDPALMNPSGARQTSPYARPAPPAWQGGENGTAGGAIHPITEEAEALTAGLSREDMRKLAAGDAQRCRAGLRAMQAANELQWAARR